MLTARHDYAGAREKTVRWKTAPMHTPLIFPHRRARIETALYGWLYLGFVEPNALKVGITATPDRRKGQIERSGGRRFDHWATYWVYAPGAAERELGRRLAYAGGAGEWFEVDPWVFEMLAEYLQARQTHAKRISRKSSLDSS